jgi:hypothetical protein
MTEEVLFDSFQVLLFLPAGADARAGDDARAALDDPPFLDRVRDAVAGMLAADPATAVLVVRVE